MAYVKQTWATGDTITAEKLNHMEDGIAAGGGGIYFVKVVTANGTTGTSDKSSTEIEEAFRSGQMPYLDIYLGEQFYASAQFAVVYTDAYSEEKIASFRAFDNDSTTITLYKFLIGEDKSVTFTSTTVPNNSSY